MAVEKHFIEEGIKESQIEEFLSKEFDRAGYSHIEIQRTPLGTRIIVFANRPGLVIGRSGSRIKGITDEIHRRFKLENPMLDVREIDNPFLDAQIVAGRIAKSLERGRFYKKVANYYVDEIMKSGAIGVEIRIGGKMGGERGRFHKFRRGYIKHAGYYADNIMDKGMATAITKPGIIGIKVKILKETPDILMGVKRIEKVEDKEPEKAKT